MSFVSISPLLYNHIVRRAALTQSQWAAPSPESPIRLRLVCYAAVAAIELHRLSDIPNKCA